MELLDQVAGALESSPRAASQIGDPLGGLRSEVAGYVTEMQALKYKANDDAMSWLSSVSARILEMMFFTLQSNARLMTKFRVEELIPMKDEIRFQFQVASRRQSVAQMEWELVRGAET